MTPTSSPRTVTCEQRKRRRLLLVGGFLVPAVSLGGALVALPAQAATPVTDRTALGQAFTDGGSYELAGPDTTKAGDATDSPAVADGKSVTLDLKGHELDLDRVTLGADAHLTVVDSSSNDAGELVVSSASGAAGIDIGDGATLTVDGAHVESVGSAGAAGIGTDAASVAEAGTVELIGGAQVTATGGDSAAGIGGGTGKAGLAVRLAGAGTRVTVHGGADSQTGLVGAIGAGEGGSGFGSLTVREGATLVVPSGEHLALTPQELITNDTGATIVLDGALDGNGGVMNSGTITAGASSSIDPHFSILGNNWDVRLDLNGGTANTTHPALRQQLYSPTFAHIADSTPTRSGYVFRGWTAGDTPVDATTTLSDVDTGRVVQLVAQWKRLTSIGAGRTFYAAKGDATTVVRLPIQGDDVQVTKVSGALPAGLALQTDGRLTGTPTRTGTSTFTVHTTSPYGPTQPDTTFTVWVGAAPTIATSTLDVATLGHSYSTGIDASGSGDVTLSAAGLPAGLTMSSDGTISGTPNGAETSATVAVTATSNYGTVTRNLTLRVGAVPAITSAAPATIKIGRAYTTALTASGTGTQHFTVDSGTLPAGLTLGEASGVLSGTYTGDPTTAVFTVKVATEFGSSTHGYSIAIGHAPSITTTLLDPIVIGSGYTGSVASTGDGVKSYALATGSTLPGTLAIDGATGAITGSYSGAPVTVSFSVTVTTAFGVDTKPYTIEAGIAPSITTGTLPLVKIGQPFSAAVLADGTGVQTFSRVSGDPLPTGLSIDEHGVISGTPTGVAGDVTFTVNVHTPFGDDTQQLTAHVGKAPSFDQDALPVWTTGVSKTTQLPGHGTDVVYTAPVNALPAGLTLSSTGQLSGSVAAHGSTTFTVTATNDWGTATRPVTVVVGDAPAITTIRLAQATVGGYYEAPVNLTGDGRGSTTWTISDGTLPAGLQLDGATGLISGSARAAGTSTFTVKAVTAFGRTTQQYTLRTGGAPVISTADLPPVVAGESFATDLALGAGTASWVVTSGALPSGVVLSSAGHLSGTVASAGDAQFTVTATTDFGTSQRTYTLSAGDLPAITTTELDRLTVGRAVTQQLSATGTGTKTFAVTAGQLPAGLSLSATGALTGSVAIAGDYDFTVTSTSAYGHSVARHYTGVAGAAGSVATAALPSATVGTAYQIPVTTAGTGDVTLELTDGSLPAGLRFDASTGVVSGTPTASGTSRLTFTATNDYGSSHVELSLAVAAAPVPAPAPAPAATTTAPSAAPSPTASTPAPAPAPVEAPVTAPVLPVAPTTKALYGRALTLSVAASSTGAVQYSVSGLPDGLRLDVATGVISGAPAEEGTFRFTVTAVNAGGSVSQRYVIQVPERDSLVTGAAEKTPVAGTSTEVKVSGLKKGERWRIKIDGEQVATGVATRSGSITREVALEKGKKDRTVTIRVSTSRTDGDPTTKSFDEFDVTVVAAKKKLTVAGGASGITVTKLAAGERVSVSEGSKLVANGRADADGVFRFVPSSLRAGKHKLVATGKVEGRTGGSTVKIAR